MEVSHVAETEENKTVKIKSKIYVAHVLRCPQQVLATSAADQSSSLRRDPAAYVSLSSRGETRVVAELIVATSPRQYTSKQRSVYLAFSFRVKHHRIGTRSQFPDIALCFFFIFLKIKEIISETNFEDTEGHKDLSSSSWMRGKKNGQDSKGITLKGNLFS